MTSSTDPTFVRDGRYFPLFHVLIGVMFHCCSESDCVSYSTDKNCFLLVISVGLEDDPSECSKKTKFRNRGGFQV